MNISGPHKVVVDAYPATTGSLEIQLQGLVVGVGLVFEVDSTIDVSINEENSNVPAQAIFSDTGLSTDGWHFPVAPIEGTDGTAIADQYTAGIPVYGAVSIDLANGAPGDIVYVTFKMV